MKNTSYQLHSPAKENLGEDVHLKISEAVEKHEKSSRLMHLLAVLLFIIFIIVVAF